MSLDLTSHLPTIITATVGAIGMIGAHRTASRAARKNAKEAAEIEAYTRARTMDLRTIERQNEEIDDLFKDNRALRTENEKLKTIKKALIKRNEELQDELRRKKNDQ